MRNNSLDTFRLLAAFAVVLLHVGYGSLPSVAQSNIRLLGRFAVPFFFMVSGYFFYQNFQKRGNEYFVKTLQRLVGVFMIASCVYLLIKFKNVSLSFSLLYEGTNYHLWFLSSMIFGVIICWYNLSYFSSKYMIMLLSVVIILLSLLSDSYSSFIKFTPDKEFCRYLLSVPYLYLGMMVAKNNFSLSTRASILLIAVGIALQIGETELLYRYYNFDRFNHQVLIGTIPFAVGAFFLSFKGPGNDWLARLGRKYSLSIYVYHQFVNFFVFKAVKFFFKQYSNDIFIFSAVISFTSTLVMLMVIDKYYPRMFAVLNGELKMLRQIFSLKKYINTNRISKSKAVVRSEVIINKG